MKNTLSPSPSSWLLITGLRWITHFVFCHLFRVKAANYASSDVMPCYWERIFLVDLIPNMIICPASPLLSQLNARIPLHAWISLPQKHSWPIQTRRKSETFLGWGGKSARMDNNGLLAWHFPECPKDEPSEPCRMREGPKNEEFLSRKKRTRKKRWWKKWGGNNGRH